jgi:hypothetical protein
MLKKLESYDNLTNSSTVMMAKTLDPRFTSDIDLTPTMRNILVEEYKLLRGGQ